jgi:hypothetical protein
MSTVIFDYQFGFREGHSTIQQTHRIVKKIAKSHEEKTLRTAVFLVAQVSVKVWHTGLLYKVKNTFLSPHYLLLKSCITVRYCKILLHVLLGNTPRDKIHARNNRVANVISRC